MQSPEAEHDQPLAEAAPAEVSSAAPAASDEAPPIRTRPHRTSTAATAVNGHSVAASGASSPPSSPALSHDLRIRLRRPAATATPAKPRPFIIKIIDWLIQHRGFWLALVAIVFAFLGQNIFNSFNGEYAEDYGRAPIFYLIGAGLLLLGFLFTYRAKMFFRVGAYQPIEPELPRGRNNFILALRETWRGQSSGFNRLLRIPWWRFALLALALYCAWSGVLRWRAMPQSTNSPNDISAILYWIVSVILLVLAVAWQKFDLWPANAQNADEYANSPIDEDGRSGDEGWAFSNHRLEILLVVVLMLVAAVLRLYNLGSIPAGVHGDEAELALLSRQLLEGNFRNLPLLGPGPWYHVPAMISYLVAPGLAIFGTESIFGMRFTTAVFGIATCFFMYLLLRLLFKGRVALIGLALIAVLDVHIQFSHYTQGAEQIATCMAAMFYFLYKGLRTKRYLDFVWAGLFGGFGGLYSYPSGRIILVLLGLVIAYLAVRRWTFLRDYWTHLAACLVAVVIIGAPILDFSVRDANNVNDRLRDVYITYGGAATTTFQRWGVPLPKEPPYAEDGGSPISVAAFSNVLRNWNNGWSNVIWKQTKVTYLTLTAVHDRIYFYETMKPLLNPLQAMLTVLGLAYFLWRWRDPRYMLFNIWFWPAMFISVAMTISAPDVLRMAGLPPAWVAFPAVLISKIVFEAEKTGWFIRPELRDWMKRRGYSLRQMLNFAPRPALVAASDIPVSSIDTMVRGVIGNVAGYRPTGGVAEATVVSRVPVRVVRPPRTGVGYLTILVALLVMFIAFQNVSTYFNLYGQGNHFTGITTPAKYIEQLGDSYYINYLGMHQFYFNHSDIRFLAPNVKGQDYFNPPDQLPARNTGDKNVAFLVFPYHNAYTSIIQSYYPNFTTVPVNYPAGGLAFNSYLVAADQVQASRALTATYYARTDIVADNPGPAIASRTSYSLTNAPHSPPANLRYPASIRWEGQIYAPSYGPYQLELSSKDQQGRAAAATLYLDDAPWLSVDATTGLTSTKLIMAQGWHRLSLRAVLPNAEQRISLRWKLPSGRMSDIAPSYFYNGPLSDQQYGLLGEYAPVGQEVTSRRVEPFIGFMDTYALVNATGPFDLTWSGNLLVDFDDTYNFMIACEGPTTVSIDDQVVVQGCPISGSEQMIPGPNLALTAGVHKIVINYHWQQDYGSLKLYWSGLNQHINQQLIPPSVLRPGKTIWLPNELAEAAGGVTPDITANPVTITPTSVIPAPGSSGTAAFTLPQGVATDAQGNIYVGQAKPPLITKFDKDGKLLKSWPVLPATADGAAELVDIAIDADGVIYALNPNNKVIELYDANGKLIGNRNVNNKFLAYAPNGLFVDKAGTIYLADTGSSRILKIDANDNLVAEIGGGHDFPNVGNRPNPKRTYQPIDVTVTDDGNIYVVDLNQRILDYTADGKYRREWRIPNIGGGQGSLHLASYGKYVYLTDTNAGGIYALDTSGDGSFTLFGNGGTAPGQFNNPAGIASGSDGQIYVADRGNGRVQIFNSIVSP